MFGFGSYPIGTLRTVFEMLRGTEDAPLRMYAIDIVPDGDGCHMTTTIEAPLIMQDDIGSGPERSGAAGTAGPRHDDIGLRATGCCIALAPSVNPGGYEQTDHDMIWTLETGFANADLAIDTYFEASSSELFDLALITAEYAHQLSAGFDMSLGFLIDPTGGPFRLVVRFDASTSLP